MKHLLTLLLALLPASLLAQTPIPIYAPGTYTAPGNYYLANDITITSGTALNFVASVVSDRHEINLNGKTIHCITSGNAVTIGIAGSGPSNLIILGGGGSWIDGCRYGVSSTRQTRVQEVIFTNIKYIGVNLMGDLGACPTCVSRVILNKFEAIGGVTDEAYAMGVMVNRSGTIVQGNLFSNTYRQAGAPPEAVGEGVPIVLNSRISGALVELNYISNDDLQPHTIGIFAGAGGGHTIQNNTIKNFAAGIQAATTTSLRGNILAASPGDVGISATPAATVSDSLVVGYLDPITGSPLGSGNVVCTP